LGCSFLLNNPSQKNNFKITLVFQQIVLFFHCFLFASRFGSQAVSREFEEVGFHPSQKIK
jgi:hypothetical protein